MKCLRWLMMVNWGIWLMAGYAAAAPHITWSEILWSSDPNKPGLGVPVDLRTRWESTRVSHSEVANDVTYEPEQIWRWSSELFGSKDLQAPVRLRAGELMVSRLTIFSEQVGPNFTINLRQPRLDNALLSYRYDNGPWTTLSAGDRIAMNNWSQPDRQPSFNLPGLAGQIDLVMQISHRGILDAPVLLLDNRAYLHDRAASFWIAGLSVGISLTMMLMGVLVAWNYQRATFLSVSLMNLVMTAVLTVGSGFAGMYFFKSSDLFNDQAKFYLNTVWVMTIPFIAALSLGNRRQLGVWWWIALAIAASSCLLSMVWMNYVWRDTSPDVIPILLVSLFIFSAAMLVWVWYSEVCRNAWIILGILLYLSSPLTPYLAFIGQLKIADSGVIALLVTLLAGVCLFRGLLLQHRMGRQVMTRANISPMRDVLTGLLNRPGMQAHLYKIKSRIQHELSCAAFIYVELQSEQAAMQLHGEEGFEMGLVQVAASLSSSVSGVDGLARVSRNAFVVTVLMPPDHAVATRVAQKILSRLMALSSHGPPLAGSARLCLSWLPLYGFRLDRLEQRSLRALRALPENKRIGWVGGSASHEEAVQLLTDMRNGLDVYPVQDVEEGDNLPMPPHPEKTSNLYERIHRIEREMLQGIDTSFLIAEAERMSRAINEANSAISSTQAPDEQPTEPIFPPSVKPA